MLGKLQKEPEVSVALGKIPHDLRIRMSHDTSKLEMVAKQHAGTMTIFRRQPKSLIKQQWLSIRFRPPCILYVQKKLKGTKGKIGKTVALMSFNSFPAFEKVRFILKIPLNYPEENREAVMSCLWYHFEPLRGDHRKVKEHSEVEKRSLYPLQAATLSMSLLNTEGAGLLCLSQAQLPTTGIKFQKDSGFSNNEDQTVNFSSSQA